MSIDLSHGPTVAELLGVDEQVVLTDLVDGFSRCSWMLSMLTRITDNRTGIIGKPAVVVLRDRGEVGAVHDGQNGNETLLYARNVRGVRY